MDILKQLVLLKEDDIEYQQNNLLNEAYSILNKEFGKNNTNFFVKYLADKNHISSGIITKTLDYRKKFAKHDIKRVCINYRLRFLDSKHYITEIPYEAHIKCSAFEIEFGNPISFKILTETRNFKSRYPKSQHLIFADLGNDLYYYITKWGTPYSNFRKLKALPYRNLELLIISVLILALIITAITPTSILTTDTTVGYFSMVRIAYYFWSVIFLSALFTYYVVGIRKSLNNTEWDSTSFM
ncbi:MAG: hypothetical protein SFY56_11970 [Bacteroidota bacterium]|nr:hypothetical protein [Bacteroidota bacterium]